MCKIEAVLKDKDNFNLRLDNSGKWLVWMEYDTPLSRKLHNAGPGCDGEWLVQSRPPYAKKNRTLHIGDSLDDALQALTAE